VRNWFQAFAFNKTQLVPLHSGGLGDKVEIQDTWEFQSHPENLFLREAFRDVVIRPRGRSGSGASARSDAASSETATEAASSSASPPPRDSLTSQVAALALEAAGGPVRLRLEVRTLRLLPGQKLHVTGSCSAAGGWDRDLAAPMVLDEESRTWHLDLDVAPEELPVHYKYALKAGLYKLKSSLVDP
jgi:hypothetical protein